MNDEQRRDLEHLERELAPVLIGPSCPPGEYAHCITCSDEALQVRVVSVDTAAGLALVISGDTTEEVDITLVDGVMPGAVLLIHGGVAIGKL